MPSRLGFRMVATMGLAIVIGSCCCERPAREIAVPRFACPGEPVVIDIIDARTGAILRTVKGVATSEPITDIPEFHDCQRFVVQDHYDSLYAIFAAFRLEKLDSAFAADSAIVIVQGGEYGVVPTATIYSHGGTYDQLGIKPGFNCLFFFRAFNTPTWSAKMVPWAGSTDPDCGDRQYDPLSTGTLLTVHASTGTPFGDKDYPPVARWDWDARNRQHYIGINCGQAWCEVGKDNFQSSVAYNLPQPSWKRLAGKMPTTGAPATNRVYQVKGWYDVQPLATAPTSSLGPGLPTPGPVRGFLIPHPLLDSINNAGDVTAYQSWGHVADAVIEGGDYPKWNFTNGQNEIWFCYGTVANCHITDQLPRVAGATTPLTSCPEDPAHPGQRWWAMIVSASGVTAYSCIERMDHTEELEAYRQQHQLQTPIRIPGAVRWRWVPSDETQWVSCVNGCCTVRS